MRNTVALSGSNGPKYKDRARTVEQLFKTNIPKLLKTVPDNWAGIRVEEIRMTEKAPGNNSEVFNQYVIPGDNGSELVVQFRSFTVKELSANLRHCPLHSGANMVMINSITNMAGSPMLSNVLSHVNHLIRTHFSSDSHCYYMLQMVSHMDHLFFYHDKEDQSMIVMRYRMAR